MHHEHTTPKLTPRTPGKYGPLPLILGISGHRDLRPEDVPALEAAVRSVIHAQRENYPNTSIILLSPLAEGADRLAARVALEEGVALYVPLPLPREMYIEDFVTEASLNEFNTLVSKATKVWTLPWVEDNNAQNTAIDGSHRDIQYGAMGVYIGRHSQIMLALWDGDDDPIRERTGGTAQIVRFRLHGAPPPFAPPVALLDAADTGAVIHIPTPRQSNPNPVGEPFKPRDILPPGAAASDSRSSLSRLDTFNYDVLDSTLPDDKAAAAGANDLLGENAEKNVPSYLKPIFTVYEHADTLSIKFARKMWNTLDRVFLLVLVAAMCFNLFHSLPHGDHGGGHGEAAHGATAPVHGETTASDAHGAPSTGHGETPAAHGAVPAPHGESSATHGTITPSGPAAHGTATEPAHGETKPSHDEAAPAHSETTPADAGHGAEAKPSEDAGHGTEAGHGETAGNVEAASLASGAESILNFGIAGIPWFLFLYLTVVGANLLVHRRAEKHGYQNRYQDYRALAEGLRVQLYWRLAGVDDEVDGHYLGKQRSELDWIRQAIKSCNVIGDSGEAEEPANAGTWLPNIQKNWVEDQRKYYTRKAEREFEDLERDERRISMLMACSIVLTILLALSLALPNFVRLEFLIKIKEWVEKPLPHGLIMVTIVMLAVCAALLHAYNDQKARSEHSKRFGRMGLLFESAEKHLETLLKQGHQENAQRVIHELGREALAENGDWVLLHRERPLEVPHAG